jgi:hypothetical protein
MSDPKLIEARDRIRAILTELDIAGHVVLHNAPGSVEILHRFDPSYSKLTFKPPMVGVRSLIEDYNGDHEAQQRDLEATVNLVRSIAEVLATNAVMLLELSGIIDEKTNAAHGPMVRDDDGERTLQ